MATSSGGFFDERTDARGSDGETSETGGMEKNLEESIQNMMTPTSRRVAAFYVDKIKKYDQHILELSAKLEAYRLEHEQQFDVERRLRAVMNQNDDLRQSLNRLRSHLNDQRAHFLLLKSENSRLQIQELADRKKIHQLLMLSGVHDEETVSLFLNKQGAACGQFRMQSDQGATTTNSQEFALQTENDILRLQLKSLKAELSERTDILLKERNDLVHEYNILLRDFETRKSEDATTIDSLKSRFKKSQEALHNQLLGQLSMSSGASVPVPSQSLLQTEEPKTDVIPATHPNSKKPRVRSPRRVQKSSKPREAHLSECSHGNQIKDLEQRLRSSSQAQKRQQQVLGENKAEISRLRKRLTAKEEPEKGAPSILQERIRILSARNRDLERRRKLDYEGFRSEIKLLREHVQDLQKQYLKLVLSLGSKIKNIDLSALEAVADGSSKISVNLKDLLTRLEQQPTNV